MRPLIETPWAARAALAELSRGNETLRLAIIGNSGSGKSTLARWAAGHAGAPCLDLDGVAWQPGQPAVARPRAEAQADVIDFCSAHPQWVVEGCYASLIAAALTFGPRLLFLNPGREPCLANCRARPWEPHKYASREAQDERLPFLLHWVDAYYTRDGELSLRGHRALFDAYPGPREEVSSLPALARPDPALRAWLE